jgi:hypothetical protein
MKMVDANHIPDPIKMVETLRTELAESKAMIKRLKADNRRVTEWLRRLENAGDALWDVLYDSEEQDYCDWIDNAHDAMHGWAKAKGAKP